MENIVALQKLERGERLDHEALLRLHEEHLVHITEVTNMQSLGPEFIFIGFTPQGFGLLEKSKAALVSDLERQILNAVVRGFLDRHEATSTSALLKRFRSALSPALQRLSHRGVLTVPTIPT